MPPPHCTIQHAGSSDAVLLIDPKSPPQDEPFIFAQMCDPQPGTGGYERDAQNFRQAVKQINGMQLVTGETTSKTHGSPLGFHIWHINTPRPFVHESVPLQGP